MKTKLLFLALLLLTGCITPKDEGQSAVPLSSDELFAVRSVCKYLFDSETDFEYFSKDVMNMDHKVWHKKVQDDITVKPRSDFVPMIVYNGEYFYVGNYLISPNEVLIDSSHSILPSNYDDFVRLLLRRETIRGLGNCIIVYYNKY